MPGKDQRYIILRQGIEVRTWQRRCQRHRKAVLGQQLPGHALVIGDDEGDLFQYSQRTAGEIVGLTRWRTNDVQRAHRRVEGPKSRLLGGNGRSGADLFDLGNQFAALVGTGGVLQALAQSPDLTPSLLPSTEIAFWLSTHIFSFLLVLETLPQGASGCLGGSACSW